MRLWHYKLIPYLDKQRLVAQWRECCCIAKNIANNGTPNHLLVNKILEYPSIHFNIYTRMVIEEMGIRGYNIKKDAYDKFYTNIQIGQCYFRDNHYKTNQVINREVFPYWHTDRYLKQCLLNLQEKFDCYGINPTEWHKICENFEVYM